MELDRSNSALILHSHHHISQALRGKGFTHTRCTLQNYIFLSLDQSNQLIYLHPWITENLLIKAGTPPRNTSQDGAYRFIYTSLYEGTIEDCNVYLRSQGLKEFTRSDRAS